MYADCFNRKSITQLNDLDTEISDNGCNSYVIRCAVVYLNDDLAILVLIVFEYCPARFTRPNSLDEADSVASYTHTSRAHKHLGLTEF